MVDNLPEIEKRGVGRKNIEFVASTIDDLSGAMARFSVAPTPDATLRLRNALFEADLENGIAKALSRVEVVDPHFQNLDISTQEGLTNATALTLAKAKVLKKEVGPRERKNLQKFTDKILDKTSKVLWKVGGKKAALALPLIATACGPILALEVPSQAPTPIEPVATKVVESPTPFQPETATPTAEVPPPGTEDESKTVENIIDEISVKVTEANIDGEAGSVEPLEGQLPDADESRKVSQLLGVSPEEVTERAFFIRFENTAFVSQGKVWEIIQYETNFYLMEKEGITFSPLTAKQLEDLRAVSADSLLVNEAEVNACFEDAEEAVV